MRVECESCKRLVVAQFAIDLGAIRATCPECDKQMTVKVEPPKPVVPVVDGPTCPKCGAARREDAAACAGCGLATARMDAFATERDAAAPEALKAAWQRVLDAWDDDKRHDALFELAAAAGEFAWIAGRYRDEVRARPDDKVAEKQIARVRRATEATLLATASDRKGPDSASYKGTIAILGVLVILVLLGTVYAILKSRGGGGDDPPPPPAHSSQPSSQVR